MLMYLSFSALPILNKIINKSPRLLNVLLAHMIGAGIQNYKKLVLFPILSAFFVKQTQYLDFVLQRKVKGVVQSG